MMKNLDVATVLTLRDQVAYQPGQVVSKTLAQNDAVSVTLFAFDKDEEISTHESGGRRAGDVPGRRGPRDRGRRTPCAAHRRVHPHAGAAPPRGVWTGAIQNVAGGRILRTSNVR